MAQHVLCMKVLSYGINLISNGIKTIENISEFKTTLKKWNGTPCTLKTYYLHHK